MRSINNFNQAEIEFNMKLSGTFQLEFENVKNEVFFSGRSLKKRNKFG